MFLLAELHRPQPTYFSQKRLKYVSGVTHITKLTSSVSEQITALRRQRSLRHGSRPLSVLVPIKSVSVHQLAPLLCSRSQHSLQVTHGNCAEQPQLLCCASYPRKQPVPNSQPRGQGPGHPAHHPSARAAHVLPRHSQAALQAFPGYLALALMTVLLQAVFQTKRSDYLQFLN